MSSISSKRVYLNICCLYTGSYFTKDDRGCIAKAIEILDGYNIGLNVWPENNGQKGGGNMLPELTQPIPHTKEAYQDLRQRVSERVRGGCSFVAYMPVVFSQYEHPGYGITPPLFKSGTPGCLIAPTGNADGVDMLHELGHGAGLDHAHGDDNRTNIMNEANGRSMLTESQVEAFRKASFASG